MLSFEQKKEISEKVQKILQEVKDDELPAGEIQFILHVDGLEHWSWANIRNSGARNLRVPIYLVQNLTS